MAVVTHYTDGQRNNIAERIGALFNLPDAGMKMTLEGWRMERFGVEVQLTIELVTIISEEEAEAIINAQPTLKEDQ